MQLRTDATALVPWARFVCEEGGGADLLRERTLTLVRGASTPVVERRPAHRPRGAQADPPVALLPRLGAEGLLCMIVPASSGYRTEPGELKVNLLLAHRAFRDDNRCAAKYVPFKIIPGVI